MQYKILVLASMSLLMGLGACSKEEGKGGTATLTGKIYVKDYNSNGQIKGEYYAPAEDVYIIYGNNTMFGDDTKTNYDGTYQFDGLRTGDYTIFAYSKCDACASGVTPVFQSVTIETKGKEVEVATITITK